MPVPTLGGCGLLWFLCLPGAGMLPLPRHRPPALWRGPEGHDTAAGGREGGCAHTGAPGPHAQPGACFTVKMPPLGLSEASARWLLQSLLPTGAESSRLLPMHTTVRDQARYVTCPTAAADIPRARGGQRVPDAIKSGAEAGPWSP